MVRSFSKHECSSCSILFSFLSEFVAMDATTAEVATADATAEGGATPEP